MKNLLAISAILSLAIFMSCSDEKVKPVDEVTSRNYDVRDVSNLNVSTAFDVEVYFDDQNTVEIITNDNVHDRIEVRTSGDGLIIKVQDNTNIKGDVTLRAIVRTTNLSGFDVSGASAVEVLDSIKVDQFNLTLSGASSFSGTLSSSASSITLSGASFGDINGFSDNVSLSLTGASNLLDIDFEIGTLQASISGASTSRLSITDELNIDLSGASTFEYSGNPTLGDVSVTGASTLRKLD